MLDAPWLMLGDFNEALWQSEHFSARRRNEKQMSEFRKTVAFCNLHDLGYKGNTCTYDKKQAGMRNVKAPEADGFPARFYQRHWGTLKTDVIRVIKEFFATGHMPELVNEIVIVLIPKKDNPELLSDFRPISLCNVLYKVVSKCLVNRLRPLLHDIISPTQSAFIPGQLITDNALIAFDGIHAITKSNDAKGKFCAYKLYLAKAYDRVD
ncbi:hypothetical protein QYE76_010928 [Lolium multiflorum]|uniref:Reverse transcriptase domain-containing protein n=1 Tax=Lolium multiflorum TaxID=4521 RepID=A0AAD8X2K4_LOLMU|nr:hypothetical protein QYE76_010928 [Lolium multiflorum]